LHRTASEYVATETCYLLAGCKQFLMICVSFYSSDDESDAVFLHVSSADEGQKYQYRSGSIALLIPNVD
jgi:hypothetical protein